MQGNALKLGPMALTAVILALATPTSAGVTARAGLSRTPDQFVIGLQAVAGHLLKVAQFAPSVDVGFGDDLRTVTVNGDVLVPVLTTKESAPALYLSTGPTLAHWSFDGGGGDTEIGWSVSGGVRRAVSGKDVGVEVRIGIGDVPDLKILAGLAF